MENNIIVWCLEAPQGNFLKEIIVMDSGNRLLFTDSWDDSPLIFGMKSQAEKFKKNYGLVWINTTDHMIMNIK